MNANALAHTLIYDRDPFSRPVSKRSRLSHKRASDQTISETKFDSVVEAIIDENGENNVAESESPPPHEEPKRKLRNQKSLDVLDGSYIARENAGHAIRYLSKPSSLEASDPKQTGTGSFEQDSKDLEAARDHTSINGDNDDNNSSSQTQNGRSYNTADALPGEVTVSVLHDAIIPIIMPFMFCSDKIRYPDYKESFRMNSFYSTDRNDDDKALNDVNEVQGDVEQSGRRMSNYKDFLYLACSHDNPPDPSDQDVPADSNERNDSMQTDSADSEHLDIETTDDVRSSSENLKEIPTAVDELLHMTSLPEEALIEEPDSHLVSKHENFQELNPEDCPQDKNINSDEIYNPVDNIEQSFKSTEPSIDVSREAVDHDAQITTDNNIFPNQVYSNSGDIENISRPDITHVSEDVSPNKADRHDKAQEGENTKKSDTVSSPTDNATDDAEKLKGAIKEASQIKPSEGGAMSRFKNFFGGKKAPTQKKENDDSDKSQINIETSKNLTNDSEDALDSANNDNSHLERHGSEPDKHKIKEEAEIQKLSEKQDFEVKNIDDAEKIKENENSASSPSETGLGRFKSLFSFPRRASKSEQADKLEAMPSEALAVEGIAELKAEDDAMESELTETLVTGHTVTLTSEPALGAEHADAMELEQTEILNAEHAGPLDAENNDVIKVGHTDSLDTQPETNYSEDNSKVEDSAEKIVKEIITASSIIASDNGSIPDDIEDQKVKPAGKADIEDETSEIEDEKVKTEDVKDKINNKKVKTVDGQATPKDGNATTEDGNATEEDGNAKVGDGNTIAEEGNVIAEDENVIAEEGKIGDGNAIAGEGKSKTEDVVGVAEDMETENLVDAVAEYEKAMMELDAEAESKSTDDADKAKGNADGGNDIREILPEDPEFEEIYEQTDMSYEMDIATDDMAKAEHEKNKIEKVIDGDEAKVNDEEIKTEERKAKLEDETNISEDGKAKIESEKDKIDNGKDKTCDEKPVAEYGKDKTGDGKPAREYGKYKAGDGKPPTEYGIYKTGEEENKVEDGKDKTEDGNAIKEDKNVIPEDRKAIAEDVEDKVKDGKTASEARKDKTGNRKDKTEDGKSITDDGKYKTGDVKDKEEEGRAVNENGKGKIKDGRDIAEDGKGIAEDGKENREDVNAKTNDEKCKIEDGKDNIEDEKAIPKDGESKAEDGKEEIEDGKATAEEGKDKTKDDPAKGEDMKTEYLEDAIAEYEKAMMVLDAEAGIKSEDDDNKIRGDDEGARDTSEITIQPEDPEYMEDYEQTDKSYDMDNKSKVEKDEAPDDSPMDFKGPDEIEEELELNKINKVTPKTGLRESDFEDFAASPNYISESNQGNQLGSDSTKSDINDDQVKPPRIKKVRFAGVEKFPQESIDKKECTGENLIPASSTAHGTYTEGQLEQLPTTEIKETIQQPLRGGEGKPELETDTGLNVNSSLLSKDGDTNLQNETADSNINSTDKTAAAAERFEIERYLKDMEVEATSNLSTEPDDIAIVADTFKEITQDTTQASNANETQEVISQDAEVDTLKSAQIPSKEPIEDEEIAYKSLNKIPRESDFNLIVDDKNKESEDKLKSKQENVDDSGSAGSSFEHMKSIKDTTETLPGSGENAASKIEDIPDENDIRSNDSNLIVGEASVTAESNVSEKHDCSDAGPESSKPLPLPSSEDYTREQDAKESSVHVETTYECMADDSTEQLKSTSSPVETIESEGFAETASITREKTENDSLQSNALDQPQDTLVDFGKKLNLNQDNSARSQENSVEIIKSTIPIINIDLVKDSDNISDSEQLEGKEILSASLTGGATEKDDESIESKLKEDQIHEDAQAGENAAKEQDAYDSLPEVISQVNNAVPILKNITSVQPSVSEEISFIEHKNDDSNAAVKLRSAIDNDDTTTESTSNFSPCTDAAEATTAVRDEEASMVDDSAERDASSIENLNLEVPVSDVKALKHPNIDKIIKDELNEIASRELLERKTEELGDQTRSAQMVDQSEIDEKANENVTSAAAKIVDQCADDENTCDSVQPAVVQIKDQSTEDNNKIDTVKGAIPADHSFNDENKTNADKPAVTEIVDEATSDETINDSDKPAGWQPENQSTINKNVTQSTTLAQPSDINSAANIAEDKSANAHDDIILTTTTGDENLRNIESKDITDIPLTRHSTEVSTEMPSAEDNTTYKIPLSSRYENEQITHQDRNISTVQLEDKTISEESELKPEKLQYAGYGNRETLTMPDDDVSTNIEEEGRSKAEISEQTFTPPAALENLNIISAAEIEKEKLAAEIDEHASIKEKLNISIDMIEDEKLFGKNLTIGEDETMQEEEGLKVGTAKRKHIPVTSLQEQKTKENIKDPYIMLDSFKEMENQAHEVENKDLTLVVSPCRIDITDAELDSMVESNKSPDNRSNGILTLPCTEELSINRLDNSDNLDATERRNSLYGSTQSLNSDPVLREMTKLVPDPEELTTPSSAAAQQRRLEWLKKKRSPHRSQDGLMEQYDSIDYYFDSPVTSSYESNKDSISRDTDDVMIFDRSPLKILWEDVSESYSQIENVQLTIKLQVIKLEESVQFDTETVRLSSIRTRHTEMKEKGRTLHSSDGQTSSNALYSSPGKTSCGRSYNTSNYDEHESPTLAERIKHFTALASNEQRDISEHKYATLPRTKHGTLRQGSSLEDVHGGASTLPGPKVRIRKLERRPDTSSFTVVEAMDSTDGISTSWISVGDIAGRWKNPQSKSKRSSSGSFGGSGTISEAEARRKEFFSSSKGYRFLDRSVSSNSLDTPSITSSFESTRSQENIERDPLDETLQE